jgi:hypothetical protein
MILFQTTKKNVNYETPNIKNTENAIIIETGERKSIPKSTSNLEDIISRIDSMSEKVEKIEVIHKNVEEIGALYRKINKEKTETLIDEKTETLIDEKTEALIDKKTETLIDEKTEALIGSEKPKDEDDDLEDVDLRENDDDDEKDEPPITIFDLLESLQDDDDDSTDEKITSFIKMQSGHLKDMIKPTKELASKVASELGYSDSNHLFYKISTYDRDKRIRKLIRVMNEEDTHDLVSQLKSMKKSIDALVGKNPNLKVDIDSIVDSENELNEMMNKNDKLKKKNIELETKIKKLENDSSNQSIQLKELKNDLENEKSKYTYNLDTREKEKLDKSTVEPKETQKTNNEEITKLKSEIKKLTEENAELTKEKNTIMFEKESTYTGKEKEIVNLNKTIKDMKNSLETSKTTTNTKDTKITTLESTIKDLRKTINDHDEKIKKYEVTNKNIKDYLDSFIDDEFKIKIDNNGDLFAQTSETISKVVKSYENASKKNVELENKLDEINKEIFNALKDKTKTKEPTIKDLISYTETLEKNKLSEDQITSWFQSNKKFDKKFWYTLEKEASALEYVIYAFDKLWSLNESITKEKNILFKEYENTKESLQSLRNFNNNKEKEEYTNLQNKYDNLTRNFTEIDSEIAKLFEKIDPNSDYKLTLTTLQNLQKFDKSLDKYIKDSNRKIKTFDDLTTNQNKEIKEGKTYIYKLINPNEKNVDTTLKFESLTEKLTEKLKYEYTQQLTKLKTYSEELTEQIESTKSIIINVISGSNIKYDEEKKLNENLKEVFIGVEKEITGLKENIESKTKELTSCVEENKTLKNENKTFRIKEELIRKYLKELKQPFNFEPDDDKMNVNQLVRYIVNNGIKEYDKIKLGLDKTIKTKNDTIDNLKNNIVELGKNDKTSYINQIELEKKDASTQLNNIRTAINEISSYVKEKYIWVYSDKDLVGLLNSIFTSYNNEVISLKESLEKATSSRQTLLDETQKLLNDEIDKLSDDIPEKEKSEMSDEDFSKYEDESNENLDKKNEEKKSLTPLVNKLVEKFEGVIEIKDSEIESIKQIIDKKFKKLGIKIEKKPDTTSYILAALNMYFNRRNPEIDIIKKEIDELDDYVSNWKQFNEKQLNEWKELREKYQSETDKNASDNLLFNEYYKYGFFLEEISKPINNIKKIIKFKRKADVVKTEKTNVKKRKVNNELSNYAEEINAKYKKHKHLDYVISILKHPAGVVSKLNEKINEQLNTSDDTLLIGGKQEKIPTPKIGDKESMKAYREYTENKKKEELRNLLLLNELKERIDMQALSSQIYSPVFVNSIEKSLNDLRIISNKNESIVSLEAVLKDTILMDYFSRHVACTYVITYMVGSDSGIIDNEIPPPLHGNTVKMNMQKETKKKIEKVIFENLQVGSNGELSIDQESASKMWILYGNEEPKRKKKK